MKSEAKYSKILTNKATLYLHKMPCQKIKRNIAVQLFDDLYLFAIPVDEKFE